MSAGRGLVQLALGSPEEKDAKCALEIILESIHAEAHALASEDWTDARPLILACRLEALKKFVTDYVTVKWAEGGAK